MNNIYKLLEKERTHTYITYIHTYTYIPYTCVDSFFPLIHVYMYFYVIVSQRAIFFFLFFLFYIYCYSPSIVLLAVGHLLNILSLSLRVLVCGLWFISDPW